MSINTEFLPSDLNDFRLKNNIIQETHNS